MNRDTKNRIKKSSAYHKLRQNGKNILKQAAKKSLLFSKGYVSFCSYMNNITISFLMILNKMHHKR